MPDRESPIPPRDDTEAEAMIAALSLYYGQRVCKASDHCEALESWVKVMHDSGYAPHVAEALSSIHLTLFKSNLAARLVYGGEAVRQEKCPAHKGRWSGCTWGNGSCEHGCMYGSNVTGWLPERHEFKACEPRDASEYLLSQGFDETKRCSVCYGISTAIVHQMEATDAV